MPIIEATIDIPLPRDAVYRISQDYSIRYDWDPFPDTLEMLNGGTYSAHIGGQVFIKSKLGTAMTVEFVQVKPPQMAAIKMITGPWYLEKFAGSWHFDTLNAKTTRVRFRYLLLTRRFLFNELIEWLAVKYFRYMTNQRLLGLRTYCETER